MNDLNTINRLNAEAIADKIPALRAAGQHVVSTYSGLHFEGCSAYATLAEAQAEVARITRANIPGVTTQLLEPTAPFVYVPTGDPAASLVPVTTLGDATQVDADGNLITQDPTPDGNPGSDVAPDPFAVAPQPDAEAVDAETQAETTGA